MGSAQPEFAVGDEVSWARNGLPDGEGTVSELHNAGIVVQSGYNRYVFNAEQLTKVSDA